MNRNLAQELIRAMMKAGVREAIVCPGARNAPLVQKFGEIEKEGRGLRTHYFYEERSAAFFALGRARRLGRPVAVVTTSGTAAGELLPAAMEAHYSGTPLVLVTADRPRRFRGCGAPQSAEQSGLFGVYCSQSYDLEEGDSPLEIAFPDRGPIHINICFEDPIREPAGKTVPEAPQMDELREFMSHCRSPLVVVGGLEREERDAVLGFLSEWQAPAYLEAISGLRERPELSSFRLHDGDSIFERASRAGYPVDGILRIGGVPTHRLWRDLEENHASVPVLTLSRLPFKGLARSSRIVAGPIGPVLEEAGQIARAHRPERGKTEAFLAEDRLREGRLRRLLEGLPDSEPGIMAKLSQGIPASALVYLGNSLPIREWDLAATHASRGLEIVASRGLNGIDGQVSTFLGLCEEGRENWAVLGDLTALYDLGGPWALSGMESISAHIAVMNNRGGRIFERMFVQKEFQNHHEMDFEAWARMWKLAYQKCGQVPGHLPRGGRSILELVPDEKATEEFWRQFRCF